MDGKMIQAGTYPQFKPSRSVSLFGPDNSTRQRSRKGNQRRLTRTLDVHEVGVRMLNETLLLVFPPFLFGEGV